MDTNSVVTSSISLESPKGVKWWWLSCEEKRSDLDRLRFSLCPPVLAALRDSRALSPGKRQIWISLRFLVRCFLKVPTAHLSQIDEEGHWLAWPDFGMTSITNRMSCLPRLHRVVSLISLKCSKVMSDLIGWLLPRLSAAPSGNRGAPYCLDLKPI